MNTIGALSCWLWLFTPVADVGTVDLKPHTVEAFNSYVTTAEARVNRQMASDAFLWADGAADRKRQLRQGQILIAPVSDKGSLDIEDGSIHDWVGSVFIPGATLDATLAMVQNYANHKNIYKPEVQDSRTLSRDGNNFNIYLRLLKKQVITVVLNTEHSVQYVRRDPTHAYSLSRTTKIAEVKDAGNPGERELTPGQDHGFLWRLNSYWRFQESDGGVYVECEAISLSRNVPTGLGWLINPIVRKLPKESLDSTLRETRQALAPKG